MELVAAIAHSHIESRLAASYALKPAIPERPQKPSFKLRTLLNAAHHLSE